MSSKTLSTLRHHDFDQSPAWYVIDEAADEADVTLAPVRLDGQGRIPGNLGQVWCQCAARFADGSRHAATAMCRGDAAEGPMAWSVWTGSVDVAVIPPPAPDFVLEKQGPVPFAASFGKPVEAIFPMTIEVLTEFAVAPHRRYATIGVDGIVETTDST